MKRWALCIVSLLLISTMAMGHTGVRTDDTNTPTLSQNKHNPASVWSMQIGVGIGTYQTIALGLYRPQIVPGGTTSWEKQTIPLNVSADLFYRAAKWLSFYGHLAVGYGSTKCSDKNKEVLGVMHQTPLALTLGVRIHYYSGPGLTVYGCYGCGYAALIAPKSYRPYQPMTLLESYLPVEFYPLGFLFGNKQGFSFEMGFGTKGLLRAGYFFNF